MAKFTFLEIHLDDSEFNASATAPFGPGEKEVEAGGADPEPEPETASSRTGAALAAIVGLAFLVVVAVVAKRRFVDGEREDDLDEAFDEEYEISG